MSLHKFTFALGPNRDWDSGQIRADARAVTRCVALATRLDSPVSPLHKFCSTFPAFVFEVRPVIPVEEAVRGELEVIAWRDGLKRK
jgi:hypothetical protein